MLTDPPELDSGRAGGLPRALAFFFGFAFAIFVAGGLYSGFIFVTNYRELMTRGRFSVSVPGGPSISVSIPQTIHIPAIHPIQLPSLPVVPEIRPSILLPDWQGSERINVVLLGIDQRDNEPINGSRSDTILIMSIDPVSKGAAMISIPRDLWVSIPGCGAQRINVAHACGGPELAQRTVEANFGITAKYYARVNFRGFEQIVDAVGGVIVDVERPIKDDEYPTEDYGYQRVYIPAGPQLMDGRVALQYARSRHSENDFGRARRQQRVLVALRDRGMQLNMLPKVPSLIGLAQQTVSSNLSGPELLALAKLASEIDRERIANLVIDTEYADPFIGDGGANLLRPRLPDIRRAIQKVVADTSVPKTGAVRVEVLNGTTRAGLATRAGEQLGQQGFQIVRVDSADRADYAETVILYFNGKSEAAATIASQFKLAPTAVRAGTGDNTVDIRVILGRNFSGI